MLVPIPSYSSGMELILSLSMFATISACTLLGRVSSRFWNIAVGFLLFGRDGERRGIKDQQRCAGHSSSFSQNLENHLVMNVALCTVLLK